jgi:TPR repeat protein
MAYLMYQLGAIKGNLKAQVGLGNLYRVGNGVTQDATQAIHWYRKAADQNYPPAQYLLGVMYASDSNVATDYIQAYMWWKIAMLNGHKESRYSLKKIALLMDSAQIEEAERLAKQWKPKQ